MSAIEYGSGAMDARAIRIVRGLYRAAIVCALAPMAGGILCVIGFWATYWGGFAIAGLFLLPIGTGMVLLGLAFAAVCIVIGVKAKRRSQQMPIGVRDIMFVVGLLLASFFVAVGCGVVGEHLYRGVVVDVINETGAPLDNCRVQVGLDWKDVSQLKPGGRNRTTFDLSGDGDAKVIVTQGGRTEEVTAIGYISGNGGHARVHVKPGLAAVVEQLR